MYQFAIIATAFVVSQDAGKLHRLKTRIAVMYAVALTWVVLNASYRLPEAVKLQNDLRDAGVSDPEFQELVRRAKALSRCLQLV